LVGTARGFRRFSPADAGIFSDLPAPSRPKIPEIVVQLRKSG
jgi:hypothetical protein